MPRHDPDFLSPPSGYVPDDMPGSRPGWDEAKPQPQPRPGVYVVFKFIDKNAAQGVSSTVLHGIADIRTEAQIAQAIAAIEESRPELISVILLNWKPLEG